MSKLQEKLAEQKYYAEVLGLWAHAAKAGYPSESVRAFTYRPEFLTMTEQRDIRQALRSGRKAPYSDLTHHNALRLVDDSVVPIPLIERPTPPGHMKVSISES